MTDKKKPFEFKLDDKLYDEVCAEEAETSEALVVHAIAKLLGLSVEEVQRRQKVHDKIWDDLLAKRHH